MIFDSMKATRDFLDGIVAIKEPSIYLPEFASVSFRRREFSPGIPGRIPETRLNKLREILMWAGSYIPWPYTDKYEQMGISRTQGLRLIKEAINIGWIIERQYHPSRRGGCIKIPRPTQKGWEELERLGRERAKAVLGGGDDHDLCGKVIKAVGRRRSYTCGYEVPIGPEKNVRVDVVLQAVSGDRIYCQCCFSSPNREADAACIILSITPADTSSLLLVCKDKAFANQLLKLLKKETVYLQHQEQVSVKVFGDVLEQYYKKSDANIF